MTGTVYSVLQLGCQKQADRDNLWFCYTVKVLAYNDIHNAWVPVCGTLCILYQDLKLDSVSLPMTT